MYTNENVPAAIRFTVELNVISHQADELRNIFIYCFLLIELKPAGVSLSSSLPFTGVKAFPTRPSPNPSPNPKLTRTLTLD